MTKEERRILRDTLMGYELQERRALNELDKLLSGDYYKRLSYAEQADLRRDFETDITHARIRQEVIKDLQGHLLRGDG